LDGRFENAYLDTGDTEAKYNELRALAHYTTQLNDGVSLIAGLGYGDMGISSGGVDFLATEGLLADIGIQAQSGQYTASLTYTHLFALHASAMSFGPSDSAPPKEDIGLLEASLGYQVNENVSAILSAQTQVLGDTEVEKDLSVTAGVRYSSSLSRLLYRQELEFVRKGWQKHSRSPDNRVTPREDQCLLWQEQKNRGRTTGQ